MNKNIFVFLLLHGGAACAATTFPVPDADDGGLDLPPGFRAFVVADNLVVGKKTGNTPERLRGLAIAPNGDLYAKLVRGPLLALRDTDGDGRFDVVKEFGPGDGGTHIAFHDGWLYHSSRTAVYRHKYVPGELVPAGEAETLVKNLPAEKDHDAKAFAFDESGGLIVEIGSPYNVYSTHDRQFGAKGYSQTEVAKFQETYGGFWRFDANKPDQTQVDGTRFSTGHRHVLALARHPVSREFFLAMMGRDNLNIVCPEYYDELDNAERPSEEMHLLREGTNIGWPYTYWDGVKKARMVAPEFGGNNHTRDNNPQFAKPVVVFPAHWAPLQMAYYGAPQFPLKYRGGMFVTFHGSWNRSPRSQAGFKVVFVPFDEKGMPQGTYETFADGFSGLTEFTNTRDAHYRPGGMAVGPDGSLYIGDTVKGRIWRIVYTGDGETSPAKAKPAKAAIAQSTSLMGNDTAGGKIYMQTCAACHMINGSGVPGMQPALVGSAVVAGDVDRLIDVLLRGPAAVLSSDREKFPMLMPPFAGLSDADLAGVIHYVRNNFASKSPDITVDQVAARRAKQ